MSEFKVGDWVKIKDDSSAWMGKVADIEYKPCFDSKWNRYEIEILVFEDGKKLGSEWAIHVKSEEITAGHRIESSNDQAISDCSVSNLCQNDTQNSLPIKQENQDMGDDSHIENHISPHCQSKDV